MKRYLDKLVMPVFGFIMLFSIVLTSGCGNSDSQPGTLASNTNNAAATTSAITAAPTSAAPATATPVAVPGAYVIAVDCPATGTTDVTIQDFFFSPNNVTVNVNGIVKWTVMGALTHGLSSGDAPDGDGIMNDSGTLKNGGTFCAQYVVAGTFSYFDCLNTAITGTITVQ